MTDEGPSTDSTAPPSSGATSAMSHRISIAAASLLMILVVGAGGIASPHTGAALALLGLVVGGAAATVHQLRRQADVLAEEAASHQHALQQVTDHDAITGLLNRRAFTRALDRLLAISERGTSFEVAIHEVDALPAVTRHIGPDGTDALLVELAGRLVEQPGAAIVGWLGEGCFAIVGATQLLDATTSSRALATSLSTPAGPISVTITTGTRRITAGGGTSAGIAVIEASLAMRAARRRGARAERFVAAMIDEDGHRAEDSLKLGAAISLGQVYCVWQPVRDPETLLPLGFETLARWEDPDRGLIPTDRWVRAARPEDLARVEARLLVEAATELARSSPDGHEWVSVNISLAHLLHLDLAGAVTTALDVSGLAAHRLVLEITEREELVLEQAVAAMRELTTLYGIRFCVDDFGAGYSTMQWLVHLPASIVKLDGSVTRLLGTDDALDGLVKAIASWADECGRILVVEAVETREQYHRCRALGIRAVQGYLTGRPATSMANLAGSRPLQSEPERARRD